MSSHEKPRQTTVRFATNDFKRTLATIESVKDGDTELRFEKGALLARYENSEEFARHAPVPLLDGAGLSIGFRVSNEKLRALFNRGRDVQACITPRDRFSCDVNITDSADDSNGLDWECERIPAESRTPQGNMLPGTILRELLRVVEPFAHNRERSCFEPLERVDLIKMTRHGPRMSLP